jgi:PAS domain S-box-containing protein
MKSQNGKSNKDLDLILDYLLKLKSPNFSQIPLVDENSHLQKIVEAINELSNSLKTSFENAKFLDLSLEMLCIAGFDGYFKKVNPAFSRVLGYSEQELISKPFESFIHPEDIEPTRNEVKKISKGLPTIFFENRYLAKDGKYRVLNWTASPDVSSGLMYATARDLTAQKESEIENRKLLLRLSQSSKLESLGQITAGVTHEINNPLAIISGTIDLMSKISNDPDKLSQKILIVKNACQRIVRIVDGLRKFSRANEAKKFKPVSISQIANEVLSLSETRAKQNQISLSCTVETDALINCDEVSIGQVLLNLFNNGIDAASTNQEKWVKIVLNEDKNDVVLHVIDSGQGIPKYVSDKMFDPFFTTKSVGMGTGLGLSISKGIIQDHSGTIEYLVEATNTCFEIRLPKADLSKKVS